MAPSPDLPRIPRQPHAAEHAPQLRLHRRSHAGALRTGRPPAQALAGLPKAAGQDSALHFFTPPMCAARRSAWALPPHPHSRHEWCLLPTLVVRAATFPSPLAVSTHLLPPTNCHHAQQAGSGGGSGARRGCGPVLWTGKCDGSAGRSWAGSLPLEQGWGPSLLAHGGITCRPASCRGAGYEQLLDFLTWPCLCWMALLGARLV